MATFTPPVEDRTPPVLDRRDRSFTPLGHLLFRHYKSRAQGRNVYLLTDGTVVPLASEPPLSRLDDADIAHTWYGGHVGETVTAAQQAALEAAGYTVDP